MALQQKHFAIVRALAGGFLLLAAGCEVEDSEPSLSADASNVVTADAAQSGADGGTVGNTPGDAAVGFPLDSGAPPARPDAGNAADAGAPTDAGPRRDASAPVDATTPPTGGGDGGAGQFEELRQLCVDTINMYRATLSLPPYARANAKLESCTDESSKFDGELNRGQTTMITPHTSTANRSATCSPLLMYGAQNTCPNWRVGPRTGNNTLADALKGCLKMMWDEGMPPVPVKDCIADKACFPKYGHWINMSSTSSKIVSCGFFDVGGGVYWMNQEFVAR